MALVLALLFVEASAASELLHRSVCSHHHHGGDDGGAPDADEDAPCAVKIFQGGGWAAASDAPPVRFELLTPLPVSSAADAAPFCAAIRLPAGRAPPAAA